MRHFIVKCWSIVEIFPFIEKSDFFHLFLQSFNLHHSQPLRILDLKSCFTYLLKTPFMINIKVWMLLYKFVEPIVEPFGVERNVVASLTTRRCSTAHSTTFSLYFEWATFQIVFQTFLTSWSLLSNVLSLLCSQVFFSRQFNFKVETRLKWFQSEISISSNMCLQVQVNIFQKDLFLHQLTHNMTKDCSLNCKFSTWKLQAQNMLCTQIVFCFDIQNNLCTQHVLSL